MKFVFTIEVLYLYLIFISKFKHGDREQLMSAKAKVISLLFSINS